MQITRSRLSEAVRQELITEEQASRLWAFLEAGTHDTPGFRATHVLYYLGGMIAIGAMSLFMTLGWESFGGWGLFAIALAYAGIGLWLTGRFLARALTLPAGIMAAFVVVLTPLAIYGLLHGLGYWPAGKPFRAYHHLIDWRWLLMELGTLAAGAILLWRYRLPFLMMPVAVTLWYMSMDLTPFLFGNEDRSWELRKLVSLWFGLAMTLLAFWVDIRNRSERDFAFWLYLFGVIAFWGGLSMMKSDSELNKFIYFCINLGMIAVGTMLSRRVFAVFGGFGAAGYLGYLAHSVFKDSLLFPFALTAIGLGVIWLGIVWQRHEVMIGTHLRGALSPALRDLIERARA